MAEPSNLAGTFTLEEHLFQCYMPQSDAEDCAWLIVVSKNGQEVRRETLPMVYRPIFGPDVGDAAARDARVEEIILELGL